MRSRLGLSAEPPQHFAQMRRDVAAAIVRVGRGQIRQRLRRCDPAGTTPNPDCRESRHFSAPPRRPVRSACARARVAGRDPPAYSHSALSAAGSSGRDFSDLLQFAQRSGDLSLLFVHRRHRIAQLDAVRISSSALVQHRDRLRQIARIGVDARARGEDLRRTLRLLLDQPIEQFVGGRSRRRALAGWRPRAATPAPRCRRFAPERTGAARAPDRRGARRSTRDNRSASSRNLPVVNSSAECAAAASRWPS